MTRPTETDGRFWALLVAICAVAAVIGALLGQLLGFAGVAITVVLLVVGGVVLFRLYRRH